MALNHVNDSKHWRDRAAEMRASSTIMENAETIAVMIRLADDYDKLADRADVRSNGGAVQRAPVLRPIFPQLLSVASSWPAIGSRGGMSLSDLELPELLKQAKMRASGRLKTS
jgi:hypothetical protein